jgi:hypothetical protein
VERCPSGLAHIYDLTRDPREGPQLFMALHSHISWAATLTALLLTPSVAYPEDAVAAISRVTHLVRAVAGQSKKGM